MTNDQEQKFFPWDGGLPTKPDVDRLLKTWPEPREGDRFDYETVERILGIARDAARFKTVTAQWRKRLLEARIVVECDPGKAFYVATCDQVSAGTYGALQFIGRKAKKHRQKLASTTPENDQQRATIEHQGRLMYAIEKDAKKSRMNLLPSTKSEERPQIGPPTKKNGEA